MIKTSIIFIACCLFNLVAIGQNKITGKWKPVFFSMDRIMTGDVKADSIYLSDTLDIVFKDDKDPAASKDLMKLMAKIMLEKMRSNQEEFLPGGAYIQTDTKQNSTKKGSYTFEASSNLLTTVVGNKTTKYIVSFKDGHLILTWGLESRSSQKGSMIVEFEKL